MDSFNHDPVRMVVDLCVSNLTYRYVNIPGRDFCSVVGKQCILCLFYSVGFTVLKPLLCFVIRSHASDQLSYLEKEEWIDKFTRAVVLEFTLFNPPTNIFRYW